LASLLRGRTPEDAFRVARIALDGFASRLPLEPLELELLGDLVAARLAAIVSISAWRARRFPENAAYIEAWDDDSWHLLELLTEPLVELAERLLATFPPETALDTVLLVNSGSEANDLAWRLAAEATGRDGALVTENAYHGVTAATSRLSPEDWSAARPPAHVARIEPPGSGGDLAAELDAAFAGLDGGLAATFLD